jgi:hypothetical protein
MAEHIGIIRQRTQLRANNVVLLIRVLGTTRKIRIPPGFTQQPMRNQFPEQNNLIF